MNCVTLRILLRYYYSTEGWTAGAPAEREALQFLLLNGFLLGKAGGLEISNKGSVHVQALLGAPWPTNGWVSPLDKLKEVSDAKSIG